MSFFEIGKAALELQFPCAVRNKMQALSLSWTEPALTNDSSSLIQVTLIGYHSLIFSGPVQNNIHDDGASNKAMGTKLNFLDQAQ